MSSRKKSFIVLSCRRERPSAGRKRHAARLLCGRVNGRVGVIGWNRARDAHRNGLTRRHIGNGERNTLPVHRIRATGKIGLRHLLVEGQLPTDI